MSALDLNRSKIDVLFLLIVVIGSGTFLKCPFHTLVSLLPYFLQILSNRILFAPVAKYFSTIFILAARSVLTIILKNASTAMFIYGFYLLQFKCSSFFIAPFLFHLSFIKLLLKWNHFQCYFLVRSPIFHDVFVQ